MTLRMLRHLAFLGEAAVATMSADRGVSETLGVLIMVLLTVLAAGVVGLFVLGEGP